MNEYEEIRNKIDIYLMKQFKYRLSLVYFTPDNIITIRRNSRIDLYLRIRRVASLFPPDCLIIARISFQKERIGHGSHFVHFLLEIALKYGSKYIGIESTNKKSKSFAEKLGFQSIDGSNYTVSVDSLIDYFSIDKSNPLLSVHEDIFQNRNVNAEPYGFGRISSFLLHKKSKFPQSIALFILSIRGVFNR